MKKLICLLMFAFLVASCERNGSGLENETINQKNNDFRKISTPATSTPTQFAPEESVDPKDIVPPRR